MFAKSRILLVIIFTLSSLTYTSISLPHPGRIPPPLPLNESFSSILSLLKSNTSLIDTPLLTLRAIKNYIETLIKRNNNAPSIQSLLPFLNGVLTQIKIFDSLNDITDRIEMSKLILNEFKQTINSTLSSIKDTDEWLTLVNVLSKALNSYEQKIKEEMLVNILNELSDNNSNNTNIKDNTSDVQIDRTKHEEHNIKEATVIVVDKNLVVIGVMNFAAVVVVVLLVCYFLRKRRVQSANVEVQREVNVEQKTYSMKKIENYNKLELENESMDGKEEENKNEEVNESQDSSDTKDSSNNKDSNDNSKVKIQVKVVK